MEQRSEVLGGTPEHEPFTVHHLSILNRRRFYWALAQRLPYKVIGSALLMSVWNVQRSNDLLIGEVNRGGLNWLYEILLETSPLEFGAAILEVKAALKKDERVMVFCKAGKDRTGLLVMLLLHIAGASDEDIVEDYHRSDGIDTIALGGLEKKEELQKLDTKVFGKAPKEAMQHAISFLRERYGTIEKYLVTCGVSVEDQRELKLLMTAE